MSMTLLTDCLIYLFIQQILIELDTVLGPKIQSEYNKE